MNIPLQVVGIGLRSINLQGKDKSVFVSYNDATEVYQTNAGEELLIRFSTEEELGKFLQCMIDKETPFFDSYYQDGYSAFFFAKELVEGGKLTGKITRSIWRDGEYQINKE